MKGFIEKWEKIFKENKFEMFSAIILYNMNCNEYINSLRLKNIIRLKNKEKIYDYLPYLHSASKEKKQIYPY